MLLYKIWHIKKNNCGDDSRVLRIPNPALNYIFHFPCTLLTRYIQLDPPFNTSIFHPNFHSLYPTSPPRPSILIISDINYIFTVDIQFRVSFEYFIRKKKNDRFSFFDCAIPVKISKNFNGLRR